MKSNYRLKPQKLREQALKDISDLLEKAKLAFRESPEKANRLVRKARRISMKYKARIPSGQQKLFCKHCYCFLMPSVNCRVRLQKSKVVYYCMSCKKFMRFPYKQKNK